MSKLRGKKCLRASPFRWAGELSAQRAEAFTSNGEPSVIDQIQNVLLLHRRTDISSVRWPHLSTSSRGTTPLLQCRELAEKGKYRSERGCGEKGKAEPNTFGGWRLIMLSVGAIRAINAGETPALPVLQFTALKRVPRKSSTRGKYRHACVPDPLVQIPTGGGVFCRPPFRNVPGLLIIM